MSSCPASEMKGESGWECHCTGEGAGPELFHYLPKIPQLVSMAELKPNKIPNV